MLPDNVRGAYDLVISKIGRMSLMRFWRDICEQAGFVKFAYFNQATQRSFEAYLKEHLHDEVYVATLMSRIGSWVDYPMNTSRWITSLIFLTGAGFFLAPLMEEGAIDMEVDDDPTPLDIDSYLDNDDQ